jgi:hypothetical protein
MTTKTSKIQFHVRTMMDITDGKSAKTTGITLIAKTQMTKSLPPVTHT